MTTLYIAGPMTGLPNFNYDAFNGAESVLFALGYDVLNPVASEDENDTGAPQAWDWYMRRALRMVTEADAIAVLPGWFGSRGALLEVHVAGSLGLQVRPLNEWIEERS